LSSSDQCDTAALRSANSPLALAHFDAQQFGDGRDAPRNLLLVESCEAEPQRIRQWSLDVKVATWCKEHATFLGVDQQFAGIKARRKFEPQTHTTFWARPAAVFGHVLAQSLVASEQARGVDLAHLGEMLGKQPTA